MVVLTIEGSGKKLMCGERWVPSRNKLIKNARHNATDTDFWSPYRHVHGCHGCDCCGATDQEHNHHLIPACLHDEVRNLPPSDLKALHTIAQEKGNPKAQVLPLFEAYSHLMDLRQQESGPSSAAKEGVCLNDHLFKINQDAIQHILQDHNCILPIRFTTLAIQHRCKSVFKLEQPQSCSLCCEEYGL